VTPIHAPIVSVVPADPETLRFTEVITRPPPEELLSEETDAESRKSISIHGLSETDEAFSSRQLREADPEVVAMLCSTNETLKATTISEKLGSQHSISTHGLSSSGEPAGYVALHSEADPETVAVSTLTNGEVQVESKPELLETEDRIPTESSLPGVHARKLQPETEERIPTESSLPSDTERTSLLSFGIEQDERKGSRQRSARFQRSSIHRVSETTLPVDELLDLGLNSFGFQQKEMCTFYLEIIQFLGCQTFYNVPTKVILAYIMGARSRYQMVPYHNLTHAFSITQFLFATCTKSENITNILGHNEMLALFSAAPMHDVDHPGNNNAWEVATRSELAIRYNDTAVLENHHAAIGLEVMKDDDTNMFGTLSADNLDEVRETFVYAILQTDMAQHFKMVDRLKGLSTQEGPAFRTELLEDRRYVAGALLHCVDISNPLLPCFDLSRKWAERINEEFLNQYRNEVKLGLPETKMWANLDTNLGFYNAQVSFIDYIVSPIWWVVTDIFRDFEAKANIRANLENNKNEWLKLAKDLECSPANMRQSRFNRTKTHRLSETNLPVDDVLDFGLNSFRFQQTEMCGFYIQILQYVGCQSEFNVPTTVMMAL
jgi:hypothetical protein